VLVVAVVDSAENAPKLKKGFAEEKWNVHEGDYTLQEGARELHDDQYLESLSMLGGAKSGI